MLKQGMPPVHPGEVLKGLYLDPLEVTITQASINLGVSRRTLSLLVNGRMGISAEMALRLSEALNTTPELWLNMQQSYDLWQAKQNRSKVQVQMMRKKDLQVNSSY
ncbi:HigA family addiction module antitoxin [Mucilaginibacter arboris]|uniref:HigA family addiction module antidote protein n=1 Tax=Mucilaginibacter arboris TaxID=2682090 RepID=A0A7K1SWA6_9SPHI|nr:HigA family addiction module antitoxin [Mucilaginibacter arboris]MVN21584.1 HigA family addiction module antidote protein [Mucilaginibacter arboris]